MARPLTQSVVEQWVSLVKGNFNAREIWVEVGIESKEGKHHLRTILSRLDNVESLGYGNYRKKDADAPEIDWQNADPGNIVPLKFPFGEHEYAIIYPKSIVIVAGSKNAGKTEYLYEFIKLNMSSFDIDLFNSETGPEQMRERFNSLGIIPPVPFHTYERYDNFADVVHPDHISVIDYLDMNSEFYLVGVEIDRIFRNLKRGVAVIGMQKPPPSVVFVKGVKTLVERDLAYGGGVTEKRAALYITMGSNKLKLHRVKTPKKSNIAPQNMTFKFDFSDEGHFINKRRSYGEESE